MDRVEFWVENLWLPIAVGVVLLVLGASANRTVRVKVWTPIGRGLRWLTTIRVTTTGRRREAADTANAMIQELQKQYVALRDQAQKDARLALVRIAALQDQVEAGKGAADAAAIEQVRKNAKANEYAREMGRAEGRAEAAREVETQRAALTVRPVWRVNEMTDHHRDDAFTLSNRQPDAGLLSDVWIESRLNGFVFDSRTQWPGPWHEPVVFFGERAGAGRKLDTTITVHYKDANGDWRVGEAVLAPPPPVHVGGRVAKIGPNDPLGPLPRHF